MATTKRPASDSLDRLARRLNVARAVVAEEFGERAAIREYLGNLPRLEAERQALVDAEQAILGRAPPTLPF